MGTPARRRTSSLSADRLDSIGIGGNMVGIIISSRSPAPVPALGGLPLGGPNPDVGGSRSLFLQTPMGHRFDKYLVERPA